MEFNVNTPLVKYAILLLSAPVWWPFFKALWKEFNAILEEEGGILGRTPDEDELREIRRAKARRESALLIQLRDEEAHQPRRRPDMGARAGFGPARPGAGRGPTPPAQGKKRGFGPPR